MTDMQSHTSVPQPPIWAVAELGSAVLGDARRTARLVALAASLANRPAASVPSACASWAATKAAYRFFSNEAVKPQDVLGAHRQATLQRIGGQPVILVVQDTSVYNFTAHPATKGLGPSGAFGAEGLRGFFVHTCLAVSTQGVPLGLLGQKLWTRPETPGRRPHHDRRPITEKESVRWQQMLIESTQGMPAGTRVVTVTDREGDIHDFFAAAAEAGQDLLVRAVKERKLHERDEYLWQTVQHTEPVGRYIVDIPAGHGQPERRIELELRTLAVTLRAPRARSDLPPVSLRAILAREVSVAPGHDPVEWRLLTTLPVQSAEDVATCLRWYTQRWKVERYHYTLKSGCLIEELQFEELGRLHRALAVYAVVAWRLLYLTYMARTEPDQPCTTVLSQSQWQALYCAIHRTKRLPQTPPDLQTAVLWIARLGGFLARKSDGPPGVKTLWMGYRRLEDLTEMWELLHEQ